MRNAFYRSAVLGLLLAIPAIAGAEVAGKYSDGNLTVELTAAAAEQFTGTLTLGGQKFPATARANGHAIDGSFTANGNSFPFTATPAADMLTLITGGTTYNLKRQSAAVNPLAAAPANPLAAAPANPLAHSPAVEGNDGALAGYTIEVSTDSGKSMVTQKPAATSVQTALEATFPDLAKYFGNRPQIGRAYEDAGNHQSGGATFSATLSGQPIKGFVSAKMIDHGATVAVIFARADVSKADWEKLASPPVADLSKLLGDHPQVITFADGTGSITVAEGWTTKAQSAIDPIYIIGPHDQNVFIGSSVSVQSSDSQLLKMIHHNQEMAQKMGMKPVQQAPLLEAEFTDPVKAMTDLSPQMSKIIESRGGPATHLDRIISHQDVAVPMPNAKAAIINWDMTRTTNGHAVALRGLATIQISPLLQGSWFYLSTGFSAPQTTFEHDQPIMAAMIASEHVNQEMAWQRVQERTNQQRAMMKQMNDATNDQMQRNHDQFMHDQNQRFVDGQARHAEQMAGYQRHNDQFAADQLQKSRNNADFVETIRGTRTVYDTQSGQSATVDLNYSTAVVNQLNEAALDPNRFVQIPLRDEMYPVTK